jgi:hypothetical protein
MMVLVVVSDMLDVSVLGGGGNGAGDLLPVPRMMSEPILYC